MGTCTSKADSLNTNIVQPTLVNSLSEREQLKLQTEQRFQGMLNTMKGEKTDWMLERKDKFQDNYRVGMCVGEGTYGEVRVCQHIRTKNKRAVRILRKNKMDEVTVNKFMTMILCLQAFDHPNILRFQEIFQDTKRFFIVTELCNGGDLFA